MRRERLFTPGPVELPEEVMGVLGRQVIHHRTPEFRESFLKTRELFKELVGSPSDNFVFFASSGTGAMEAAVLNFFSEGDRVLVVVGGKFGERWARLCRKYGLRVKELEVEWGKSVDVEVLRDFLRAYPDCKGVFIQACETSTGAYHDVRAVGEVVGETDALLVVDGITALGVYNIKPELWGIDIIVGGSQKALTLPPGLSLLWYSEKASHRLTDRAYYFSVLEEIKKQKEGQTAWTPAVPLILALRESLSLLLKRGMDKVEREYRAISEGMGEAVASLGLEILPQNPSISLTAIKTDMADDLRGEMLRMGVRVAGGQGRLKGKVLRISHMGMSALDMVLAISSLELAVKRLGFPVKLGTAVGTYLETVERAGYE